MLTNRIHDYEPQVYMLYNTLKFLDTPKKRAQLLADQARVPDGEQIIQGTLTLFSSKLQVLRKKEWEEHCNLPEYPGNQEDVGTIEHIQKLGRKIEQRYQRPYDYLAMIIIELAGTLNQPGESYLNKYGFMAAINCRNLLEMNDSAERKQTLHKIAGREDGLSELNEAIELLKNMRWATRKELWDEKKALSSETLTKIDKIIDEINSMKKKYDPGFYATGKRLTHLDADTRTYKTLRVSK